MLLNTFNAGAAFNFSRDHATSFGKPAVEAELHYLANFDASEIRVEESGHFLVLDGSVRSSVDLARAVRVAADIVGRDNVICQLVIVQDDKSRLQKLI